MSTEIENEYQEGTNETESRPANPNWRWYVIHTYSGYEGKVKQLIDKMVENNSVNNLINRVVVPMVDEVVVGKDGKEKTVSKRAFPGYVLVEMECTKESWYWVRNVKGVTGFVGADPLHPDPLSNDEVRNLNIDVDDTVSEIFISGFQPDDKIRVIAGPLAGTEGKVETVLKDKKCIKAIVTMFGREISAELEYSQVEKAED